MTNKHIGSSFEGWLKEEGIADATYQAAAKELLVERDLMSKKLAAYMKKHKALTDAVENALSPQGCTIDPAGMDISLMALCRAATELGMTVRLELIPKE